VDDGSTDDTPKIISDLKEKYSWIISLRLPPHPRDITFHYAYVCRQGFKFAIEYAKENHIPYEYVGLLDADTMLEPRYFEKLIEEFEKDKNLGIASGAVYVQKNNRWVKELNLIGHPRGTGRLWGKRCFFDTGGYRLLPSPDSVSNRLAIKMGYTIREFEHIKAYQLRETSSAEGKIKGYIKNGEMARYLGKPLTRVILGSIWISIINKNPLYSFGYIYGAILSGKKIDTISWVRDLYTGGGYLWSLKN
jgi:glycosyltransferase involved in cell wall biosynthesis